MKLKSVLLISSLGSLLGCKTIANIDFRSETKSESELCPQNYARVLANPDVGTTSDFCVAKYEMKDVGGVATSQAAGPPWVNINQADAKLACQSLGAGYALISNPEWMTIARDIEQLDANWSNGIAGVNVPQGILNRGWSAHPSYGDAWQHTAVAPVTDASCLYSSAANTCSASGDWKFKRTHMLSTHEEIWDFSANVLEWVDWNVTPLHKAYSSGDGQPVAQWREGATIDTKISSTDEMKPETWESAFFPALSSAEGLGRYYAGTNVSGGAALRGGIWNHGSNAGIFTLNLNGSASTANAYAGFRCVFHP